MRDHTKLRAFELADEVALLVRLVKAFSPLEIQSCTRRYKKHRMHKEEKDILKFSRMAIFPLYGNKIPGSGFAALGYFNESSRAHYDSKLLETEKVLGALIRSLRSPNRLQSKQPE